MNGSPDDMPQAAMVLAAGLGTRLRAAADGKPKPLVEVGGMTLVDHAIGHLADVGVRKIVVNMHYRADMLRAHFAEAHPSGVEIVLSDESGQLLDTGGGVKAALEHLGDTPFFVVNGKLLWRNGPENSLRQLALRWSDSEMDALLLVVPTVMAGGYEGVGDFGMAPDGQLARRAEQEVAPFVYSGIQLVHPRLFADSPEGPFSFNLLWDRALENGRLFGVRHDEFWMHVSTPAALREARQLYETS